MSGEPMTANLVFWALMALMAGGAVALLLAAREWLSSGGGEGPGYVGPQQEEPERGRGGRDLAVYGDQLRELEADLAQGLLTEAEAESARLEIERRVLAADRERRKTPQAAAFSPGLRRRSLVALIVLIPVAALGLYLLLGAPGLPGQPFTSRSAPGQEAATETPQVSEQDIAAMVARLAAKLEQEPENLEGWKMLAQSYLILERPAEARAALREGMAQFPHDPDLILTTARLEVLLAQEAQRPRVRRPQKGTSAQEEAQGASENAALPGGDAMPRIPPEAAHLFRRLLTIMPDHGEALWMVGLAEVQAGNRDKALELWRRLLSDIAEDSESHTMLEGYIRALEK